MTREENEMVAATHKSRKRTPNICGTFPLGHTKPEATASISRFSDPRTYSVFLRTFSLFVQDLAYTGILS